MAALYAITSSFFYALSTILTRKGFRYTTTSHGAFISIIACFISVLIFSIFTTSFNQYLNRAFFLFLAAGIIGPFIGRLLLYKGIERVGAAISATLYEDKPLFSVLAAVFVLGEDLTIAIGMGVVLMMAGSIIVSLEESGGQIEKNWSKKDLLFPLVSGACYGVSHIFRKMGLNISPEPMVGVMVQNIGAIAFIPFLTFTARQKKNNFFDNKKAWLLFSFIGILQVFAQWCLFKALDLGTVVVVSPLASVSTFFVLILTVLFLKGLEKVTWKIVVGAVLMVGAALILTTYT